MRAKTSFGTQGDGSAVTHSYGGDVPPWFSGLLSWHLPVKISITLFLLALVAWIDSTTGSELSFSVFYLAPVLLAGGLVSRSAGRITAIACAATWGYLDVSLGSGYSAAWIPLWNSAVRLTFFLIINELVSMLRIAHARERVLARTDTLTGLANARVFGEHLNHAIAQCRRDGRLFTLAYLDLDRFKKVNDDFGHSEGDCVLQAVASTIRRCLRATDAAARLGGDEFGILMRETDGEQARALLERVTASLAHDVEDRWGVSATFGSVTFTQLPDDADFALREADALMYRGKAAGRGCILQATWPETRMESE